MAWNPLWGWTPLWARPVAVEAVAVAQTAVSRSLTALPAESGDTKGNESTDFVDWRRQLLHSLSMRVH